MPTARSRGGDRLGRWSLAALVVVLFLGFANPMEATPNTELDDILQVWPLHIGDVTQLLENSVHYAVESELGIAQWNATLPTGGAVVYLGTPAQPYTVSLFHELRCLNIIREIIVEFYANDSPDARPSRQDLADHCMNYHDTVPLRYAFANSTVINRFKKDSSRGDKVM